MEKRIILWFEEITKGDIAQAGGKGANLGELTQARVPVPPGFVVSAAAYYQFLEKASIRGFISEKLAPLNTEDTRALREIAQQIQQKILQAPMPPEIAREIARAYEKLGEGLVAVRSSATAEDLPEASFAGQQRTFLNVTGKEAVIRAVQACWASLFESRAIFYRSQHGFNHLEIGIAVPVQRMVQSEVSGVMFTAEPVTSDENKILIEAVFGLGEAIVSGEVTPDLYIVNKQEMKITETRAGHQEWQMVKNPVSHGETEGIAKVYLTPTDQGHSKLTPEEVLHLARWGQTIEDLYQYPQDIEWAKANGELFILQARPVTTLKLEKREELPEPQATPIFKGISASPGMGAGPVRLVKNIDELYKVTSGDVLVTEMTTPDYVPAMKKAVAIITDRGGKTAHAAIVSREMGIPCVVGTVHATRQLSDGQIVTVDGSRGKVYAGNVVPQRAEAVTLAPKPRIRTTTRVYVNLAEPELAEAIAAQHVDGVGLLRAEFMVAHIGEHPRHMLAEKRGHIFVDRLAQGLTTFAKAFHPRPVVYRTTDFKTNEYRNLVGGAQYEEEEENPMIGYRGCSRYIRELDVFSLETEAIKKVRESYDNLWVMVPFVRTVPELSSTKQLLEAQGLRQSPSFKLWMMVEVPSNIFLLDQFIDQGIDGISIGSNDLTQLILGIDRDNPKLAEEFDERDPAVLMALEQAVKTAKARGITSSICGQAPSFYPDLTEKLVRWGITSVSVSPDMIEHTREIVAQAEAQLATPSRLRRLVRSWELAEES